MVLQDKRTSNLVSAFGMLLVLLMSSQDSLAQSAPEVFKIDPPSWWFRQSINPVRLLIHGRNLKGATLRATGSGIRLGQPTVNSAGTYLFVDAFVPPQTHTGQAR